MATTLAQRTAVINLLKQKKAETSALDTALGAVITALDPATSDSDDIQAAVDVYTTARSVAGRATYGNIQLPALEASDALSAIAAEAAETP